ncbi:MAG: GxxExxY protein [Chloroflexi bacterium]|nr:GxxExxY protein [Dehalococcoidia bacterium]MCZ7575584.1 GxxExxY protein [Dehalococcoidia bacterium]NJD65243.1 GxxExxY protein [Chloroflexota bacterium]PWB45431.1 MAG: GxxExxY protein [Dehalococcoidia bacterium]
MTREPDPQLDELASRVIGAAIEVHRVLGPGFLESVYEAALCAELEQRSIAYARQAVVEVSYKGRPVGESRLDLLVERRLIVELKAIDALAPIHMAQVLSYLRATGIHLALLINFNVPRLRDGGIKRVIRS